MKQTKYLIALAERRTEWNREQLTDVYNELMVERDPAHDLELMTLRAWAGERAELLEAENRALREALVTLTVFARDSLNELRRIKTARAGRVADAIEDACRLPELPVDPPWRPRD
jgi:hypothetical protein